MLFKLYIYIYIYACIVNGELPSGWGSKTPGTKSSPLMTAFSGIRWNTLSSGGWI